MYIQSVMVSPSHLWHCLDRPYITRWWALYFVCVWVCSLHVDGCGVVNTIHSSNFTTIQIRLKNTRHTLLPYAAMYIPKPSLIGDTHVAFLYSYRLKHAWEAWE